MNEVTTRKLADNFKILINDVEQLVKETANQAGERLGNLLQRLETKIEDGRKALAGHEKGRFQKSEKAKTQADWRLCENSWAGLVIASVIGVFLGLLLRRR